MPRLASSECSSAVPRLVCFLVFLEEPDSRYAGRTWGAGTRFESQHLLADGIQCPFFFAQDIPGFFAGDLSLAKLLDHRPYLSAVFVGPFLKSVRRT